VAFPPALGSWLATTRVLGIARRLHTRKAIGRYCLLSPPHLRPRNASGMAPTPHSRVTKKVTNGRRNREAESQKWSLTIC
jgi:hypothetical protein